MAQSRRGSEQAHGLSKKRSVRSGWPLEGTTRKPALVGDRDGQVRGRHGPLEGTLAARAHAGQKAPRPQSHSPTGRGEPLPSGARAAEPSWSLLTVAWGTPLASLGPGSRFPQRLAPRRALTHTALAVPVTVTGGDPVPLHTDELASRGN